MLDRLFLIFGCHLHCVEMSRCTQFSRSTCPPLQTLFAHYATLQDTAKLILHRCSNLPPGKNVPFCSVGGHLMCDTEVFTSRFRPQTFFPTRSTHVNPRPGRDFRLRVVHLARSPSQICHSNIAPKVFPHCCGPKGRCNNRPCKDPRLSGFAC